MADKENVCNWCGVTVPEGWPSCEQFHAREGTDALRPKIASGKMPDLCVENIRKNVPDI